VAAASRFFPAWLPGTASSWRGCRVLRCGAWQPRFSFFRYGYVS
jgi:hypothetical protein